MNTPHPLSAQIRSGRWLWTTRRLGNILLTRLWKTGQEDDSIISPRSRAVSCRTATTASASGAVCVGSVCPQPRTLSTIKHLPRGTPARSGSPLYGVHQERRLLEQVLWRTGNPLQACRLLLPKWAHLLVQQHPWGWRWRSAAAPGRTGLTGRRAARAERRSSRTRTGRWWRADPAAAGRGRCHPGDPPTHPCAARKKIRKGIKTPRWPNP